MLPLMRSETQEILAQKQEEEPQNQIGVFPSQNHGRVGNIYKLIHSFCEGSTETFSPPKSWFIVQSEIQWQLCKRLKIGLFLLNCVLPVGWHVKINFFWQNPQESIPTCFIVFFFGEASSFFCIVSLSKTLKKSVLQGGTCSNLLQKRGFLISALRRKKWCFNDTEVYFLTIKFLKLIPRLWIWFFSTEGHVPSSHRHLRTPHNFCKTHWTSHQRFAPPWLHWSFLPAMRFWDFLDFVCIMQGSPVFQFFLSVSIFFPGFFILLHLPWSSPHPNPHHPMPGTLRGKDYHCLDTTTFFAKIQFVAKKFFPWTKVFVDSYKTHFLSKVFNENTKETVLLFL